MQRLVSIVGVMLMTAVSAMSAAQQPARHWAIVVHGGAGVIEKSALGPDGDKAYRAGLDRAIHAGAAVLDKGGSALDAVEATLHVLEEDPHFNAGKGAVFTREGKNEMDASIMDGSNLKAGAVAGVQRVHSPISAARAVMEKSPHVMIAGRGADDFAAGTVASARHLPKSEVVKAKDDGRLPMEDHNTRLIVVGQDGTSARFVAEALAHEAFHNVSYFRGTFAEASASIQP